MVRGGRRTEAGSFYVERIRGIPGLGDNEIASGSGGVICCSTNSKAAHLRVLALFNDGDVKSAFAEGNGRACTANTMANHKNLWSHWIAGGLPSLLRRK